MVIDSINKSDMEIKKELYSNIVITGGNTLFNMFLEKIQRKIYNNSPPNVKIKINTAQSVTERKFSTWIGGSILASVGNFHQLWLSKQEYDEHGSILIERKCP
jgi:actin-like protein 6A